MLYKAIEVGFTTRLSIVPIAQLIPQIKAICMNQREGEPSCRRTISLRKSGHPLLIIALRATFTFNDSKKYIEYIQVDIEPRLFEPPKETTKLNEVEDR